MSSTLCLYNETPSTLEWMLEGSERSHKLRDSHFRYFHSDCVACTPYQSKQDGLCRSCYHLRLRHFLLCETKWEHISLGLAEHVFKKDTCSLCRVITTATNRYWRAAGFERAPSLVGGRVFLENADPIPEEVGKAFLLHIKVLPSSGLHSKEHASFLLRVQIAEEESTIVPFAALEDYGFSEDGLESSDHFQLPIHSRQYPSRRPVPDVRLSSWQSSQITLKPSERAVLVGPRIRWKLVREWLKSCKRSHPECFPEEGSYGPPSRIIDVEQRSVVKTPPRCRYVALSYVWGAPSSHRIKATKDTIKDLETKGALSSTLLSQTIEDAIVVCIELDMRYLWVDSLCIIQDDLAFKMGEIRAMDLIYKSASLTIVAADGVNAESGLPGVNIDRNPAQIATYFQDLEVREILPNLAETVDRSLWNTRGWTYQERILSHRMLFLTMDQVYFQCQKGVIHEDCCVQDNGNITYSIGRMHTTPTHYKAREPLYYVTNLLQPSAYLDTFVIYAQHVEEYSSRTLSIQSDILNAFAGIYNTLSQDVITYSCFGLPKSLLNSALLWEPISSSSPRVTDKAMVLPSWSWISCQGSVKYYKNSFTLGSLVDWYVCLDKNSGFEQVSSAPQWINTNNHDYTIERQSYGNFEFNKISPHDYVQSAKPGRLLCHTQTAKFKLDSQDHDFNVLVGYAEPAEDSKYVTIRNDFGEPCGYIQCPVAWLNISLSAVDGKEPWFEFIALSAGLLDPKFKRLPGHSWREFLLFDPEFESRNAGKAEMLRTPPPVLNVMLIGWDEGIAHRVSVGFVYLVKWKKAKPQLKKLFWSD